MDDGTVGTLCHFRGQVQSTVLVTTVTYLGFEYRSVHDGDRRGFTVKLTDKYVDECLDTVQLQHAKAVMTPLTEQKSLNLHDVWRGRNRQTSPYSLCAECAAGSLRTSSAGSSGRSATGGA